MTAKFTVAIWCVSYIRFRLLTAHSNSCSHHTSGGGVGGLTAALAISHFSAERKDIFVDLYEAAPSFTEVGAGIGMYKRTWKVMKALGLEEGLRGLTKIPKSDDDLGALLVCLVASSISDLAV